MNQGPLVLVDMSVVHMQLVEVPLHQRKEMIDLYQADVDHGWHKVFLAMEIQAQSFIWSLTISF